MSLLSSGSLVITIMFAVSGTNKRIRYHTTNLMLDISNALRSDKAEGQLLGVSEDIGHFLCIVKQS